MSEYWVSKKKYFCKYCDTYIADDVPSRQHHENGLRHKGNLERFVRGIYKAGEKQKKDREEEIREMKRVEQAAAAAFAQDIAAGIAKPSGSITSATTAKKPPPKPSSAYENYSTAASLGYTDPDADRLSEEMRIRQTQGVAGEWQVVTSTAKESAESSSSVPQRSDTTAAITTIPDMTGRADVGMKREAEGPPAEEDIRTFKLRKKQLTAGLGEIYDPGLIPIKVKKKEELPDTPLPGSSPLLTTESKPLPQTVEPSTSRKWTTIQWAKRPDQDGAEMTKVEGDTSNTNSSSKWAKATWSQPIPDIPVADRTPMFGLKLQEPDVQTKGEMEEVKSEENGEATISRDPVPSDDGVGGIKFKKRRAPVNAGRGRREV